MRHSYWNGPGRVLLTNLPNTVWIAHGNTVIKAAPERVRLASEEESLSISGWLSGITERGARSLPEDSKAQLS